MPICGYVPGPPLREREETECGKERFECIKANVPGTANLCHPIGQLTANERKQNTRSVGRTSRSYF